MDKFTYYIFRFFVFIFRIIPFFLLYIFADFVYFLLYKVIAYRKKIVRDNLVKSFPSKTKGEIDLIESKFYKNLAVIMLESLKGFSMSAEEIRKRYQIINIDVANNYFAQNKSIIAVAAHYANWEWGIDGVSHFQHTEIGLYKPLANKYIDNFFKNKRSEANVELVPITETRSEFAKVIQKPRMFVMVADQNPGNKDAAIWVDFLGRDTACLHGPEYYARKYQLPIVYFNVQRVKKGFYTLEVIDLGDKLWEKPQGEITRMFMNTLESLIHQKPEDWLWSHKRWKHKREKSESIEFIAPK